MGVEPMLVKSTVIAEDPPVGGDEAILSELVQSNKRVFLEQKKTTQFPGSFFYQYIFFSVSCLLSLLALCPAPYSFLPISVSSLHPCLV
jgi:hypothetical protein